jgi:NADPH:quinone reductase-like Zn-dependent oxidoreductase
MDEALAPRRARALVYDLDSPSRMRFASLPCPDAARLRDGELLVDVHCVALNPVDYKLPQLVPLARLVLQGLPVAQDFSGVVAASRCARVPVGARVFGTCDGARGGCAVQAVVVRADKVAVVPAPVSLADAAALNTTGQTAVQALRGLGPGGRVLVVGASGGCGSAGVQVARALVGPAGAVAALAGGASTAAVRALGADVVVDYRSAAALTALAALPPFDVIYDTVSSGAAGDDLGGVPYRVALAPFLRAGGTHVQINGTAAQWLRALLGCQPRGFRLFMQQHSAEDLARVGAWAAEGALRAVVDSEHPFTERGCADAYARVQSRRAKGKVLLKLEVGS